MTERERETESEREREKERSERECVMLIVSGKQFSSGMSAYFM